MLYDSATNAPDLRVVGFVAARVMDVQIDTGKKPTFVDVTLQPTMLVTCTAITDSTRRTLGPRTIFNPYVARARLLR